MLQLVPPQISYQPQECIDVVRLTRSGEKGRRCIGKEEHPSSRGRRGGIPSGKPRLPRQGSKVIRACSTRSRP
jgi:hypothetical protein